MRGKLSIEQKVAIVNGVSRLKDPAGWNESVPPGQDNNGKLVMDAVYGLILIG